MEKSLDVDNDVDHDGHGEGVVWDAVGRPNKGYADFGPVDGSTVRRRWRHLKRGHKVLDEGLLVCMRMCLCFTIW
jgi:hypothetical protein